MPFIIKKAILQKNGVPQRRKKLRKYRPEQVHAADFHFEMSIYNQRITLPARINICHNQIDGWWQPTKRGFDRSTHLLLQRWPPRAQWSCRSRESVLPWRQWCSRGNDRQTIGSLQKQGSSSISWVLFFRGVIYFTRACKTHGPRQTYPAHTHTCVHIYTCMNT